MKRRSFIGLLSSLPFCGMLKRKQQTVLRPIGVGENGIPKQVIAYPAAVSLSIGDVVCIGSDGRVWKASAGRDEPIGSVVRLGDHGTVQIG